MEGDDGAVLSVLGTVLSVVGAATAAGLTMGLMSQDSLDLLVLVESDPADCKDVEERRELEQEKRYAAILLPLVEDHHRLLVTLLLINSLCAEALPIFLDELVPSSVAVLLGVFLILIFGEVVPSAVFTGPSGMKVSAALSPLVKLFLFLFAPLAIPVGQFLDWWVGDEDDNTYNRSELLALLRLHAGKSAGKLMTVRQSRMMQGTMDLMHLAAHDVMTPVDKMFMLSTETELNLSQLALIVGKGHSRIPVFEKANVNRVKGVLLTKTLAVIDPNDRILVGNLFPRICGCVKPDVSLYDVMAVMRATRSHICLVTDDPVLMSRNMRKVKENAQKPPPKLLGCISLHDIIGRIVDGDIADEYSHRRAKKNPDRVTSSGYGTPDDSSSDDEQNPDAEAHAMVFKSEFARERVMRWLERARLSTKLHQHLEARRSQSEPVKDANERSGLFNHEGSTNHSKRSSGHSSAVARKLLSGWLLKKTSARVTSGQIQTTLPHVQHSGSKTPSNAKPSSQAPLISPAHKKMDSYNAV